MKNELQADAQLGCNATLEWISDQAKLETFECNNDIDKDNTSKQNNHVGDNNEGGNQNMSEEEDGGKRVHESSSSDDDEDENQYQDDNDKANKEKITTSFWENDSDEENEWNEQGSTDGDINRDDKTQDESEKIMPVTMQNMKMTPTSKRVGARARLGVMMISLALDVRIRKKERD